MAFKKDEVAALLVGCHRRCCICHRFCGTKIESHHIEQSDPPNDAIDNAILVCFECHAEIASYNPDHPRGRRFASEELRGHKDQWLQICRTKPEVLIAVHRDGDVGPLQALLDELEYNRTIAAHSTEGKRGAIFLSSQFQRAIQEGMVALLEDGLRTAILEAYVAMSRANPYILAESQQNARDMALNRVGMKAKDMLKDAQPVIEKAHEQLLGFLAHEKEGTS